MNLKDIRKIKRAIRPRPADDISDLLSLRDNFIYSLLINTKYKEEIEGYSVVELSEWIRARGLQSDYDLLELVVNNNEEEDIK